MDADQRAAAELRDLAGRVMDVINRNSAGENTRRENWSHFVRNLPCNHNLLELTKECIEVLSEDQRRIIRGELQR